jgi:hypothetical protein
MKVLWYLVVLVLGAWGVLAALRTIEMFGTGGLSAYGAGRVAGSLFMAVLMLVLAAKALAKARSAK